MTTTAQTPNAEIMARSAAISKVEDKVVAESWEGRLLTKVAEDQWLVVGIAVQDVVVGVRGEEILDDAKMFRIITLSSPAVEQSMPLLLMIPLPTMLSLIEHPHPIAALPPAHPLTAARTTTSPVNEHR